MLFLTKQDNFYHKICGDLAEENAFVLFINLTVVMSAANQYFHTLNWPRFCTSQFQNCPFTILHISHNTPCLPAKTLNNLFFKFLLGITVVLREIKRQCSCKKFGGKQGVLSEMYKQRFHPFCANPQLGIFKDKKERKGMLIDVAVPSESNTSAKFTEKLLACENICFSSPFAAGDVLGRGMSATQLQKFHTDDAIQCLHNKSNSHGVPNTNLSNFTCLLVDFGKVLCSSANELQQNSNASGREDYNP